MRHRGVSLLELTFVLFILTAVTVLSGPVLIESLAHMRLTSAAQTVAAGLRHSRMVAIARQHACRVRVHAPLLVTECDPSNWQSVRALTLPATLSVSSSAAPLFHPEGFVTPASTFTVTDTRGRRRRIIVNMTGRVRVQ